MIQAEHLAERERPTKLSKRPLGRSGIGRLLLAVWLALTVARLLHSEPLRSANDRSRWCTVWSLVEEGTYQIDTIRQRRGWDTIDLVKHDGHFYSTKPPVFPTLIAGLYWLEKSTLGWTLDHHLEVTSRLLLLFVNVLPMLWALGLLGRIVRHHSNAQFTYVFIMASACFATLLCPFLIVLNNHTPAAVCVIFALSAVVPILAEKKYSGVGFAAAGFWAACTCCFELPAAAFGLATFVLLFLADRKRTLLWFVPAALVPLSAFFITNYLATGGWKPFYLFYGSEKYEFIHNGVPSYWMNPRGLDRAGDNPLIYLLHCTVGHHGILLLSPIFLLTLGSWLRRSTWKESRLHSIHWLGLGLTLLVFGFFMTKTENYNYGGVSVALRWMLWLVPFWLLAMIPLLERWHPQPRSQLACLTLLALSTFSAWYPLHTPWTQPWVFNVMTSAGLIDYSDSSSAKVPPYHSWIRQLPADAGDDPLPDYWIEFEGLNSAGLVRRLRLADGGVVEVNGIFGRRLVVTETIDNMPQPPQEIVINRAALEADADVERIVLLPDGQPTSAERIAAIDFVRGLPAPRAYSPGKLRFVFTPLRDEAFQTRHAASRVLGTSADAPRPTVIRRDVWASDEVPYGVVEFRTAIQDGKTGEVLHQSTMRAVAAGHVEEFDRRSLVFE